MFFVCLSARLSLFLQRHRLMNVYGQADYSPLPARRRQGCHPVALQQDRQGIPEGSRQAADLVGTAPRTGTPRGQLPRHVCRHRRPAAGGPAGSDGRPGHAGHPVQPRRIRSGAPRGQAGLQPLPGVAQVAHRLQRHHRPAQPVAAGGLRLAACAHGTPPHRGTRR